MRGLSGKTKINSFLAFFRVACLLSLTVFVVNAERLPVKIYTSADGLGSSATFNLVRDARGFIWICSRDGLVRFDGYRFITYRIGDDDADPAVFNLLPARNNVYWVNLNRGTDYRFIPKNDESLLEQIRQSPAKNDARIPLLAEPLPADQPLPGFEDRAGNLWTADEKGLLLLRETDGRLTSEVIELNLPGNPDKGLTRAFFRNGQDGEGFWVGTHWGLVRRLADGKTIHYTINPQNNSDEVFIYAEDKERRVWIARPEGLIVLKTDAFSESTNLSDFTSRRAALKQGVFNPDGSARLPEQPDEAVIFSFEDILRRDAEDSSQPDYLKPEIYSMICASDGRLWITGNHGLIVFDGKRFQQYTTEQGLASNTVANVVEDNEGHVWLTTYGGLHRINPKGLTTYDKSDGLENERIHSIYEDRDGELNVVSGNFNISRLQPDGTFKMVRPQLPAGSTMTWLSTAALLDSRGDWWVNTQNGVYRYTDVSRLEDLNNKPPTAVYNKANGLLGDNTMRVFEDSAGDLWFSTWVTAKPTGVTRWRRETGQFEHFTKENGLPEPSSAAAFAEDSAGNFWFGFTDGGGIARFRDGRFTLLDEPNSPKAGVTSIFRDKSGRLWIATTREGLIRVDAPEAEHPVFRRYTINDGLTSNNARCITEDFYGNIYVGTVRGVNRLSPETGHIKYYGTSDGLASDFINSAYRDRHGTIWFGTFNGLSKLVPEPDAPAAPPPPVFISGLRIAGEDYSVSPLGQREVYVPEQSSDRNNLQIDFLSITTGDAASTRYQYRLEGVDADWSEPSAERSVTFANLSPGAYRFLARAVNIDNAAGATALVSFTVLRPLWQRWWFLLLAAFAVSFLIYVLYRYRIAQVIKLERVRTRIATDLHDDIGSSLSKIAILSEVVRQRNGSNGNGKDSKNEPLEIIANTSREMVDSMSDIVWAINPERDHLSDLIQRMRHFTEELLDARDIDYQFRVPENLKDISLGADLRREIYLIFKECVNNLAKHSGATETEFTVHLENENLIIGIKDNGRGFDVAQKSGARQNGFGGNGLGNMKKRAKKCGGELQIDSEIGTGTKIVLEIPVGKNYFSV
jgi:ligand-binding sensor domain-containing protein/signal transduction histidine kinase